MFFVLLDPPISVGIPKEFQFILKLILYWKWRIIIVSPESIK